MELHSYPKVWAIGHPAVKDLFDGAVVVQEKIDGSQFSFGLLNGELFMRSKGAAVYADTADKLFQPATSTAVTLLQQGLLVEGWVYRGEAVAKPKHNTKEYERRPDGGFILFDIDHGLENRWEPERLEKEASYLGLECVPLLYHGVISNPEDLKRLLDTESCLGGTKVEGVVAKNYNRWGEDGKMLMGKFVSEEFKEAHRKEWKTGNPGKKDVIERIIETYRTNRRWEKAVERRRDGGELLHAPQDIGPLMKSVPQDVKEECEQEIRDALFKEFWPDISRGLVRGLPEWYKNRLLEEQFSDTESH